MEIKLENETDGLICHHNPRCDISIQNAKSNASFGEIIQGRKSNGTDFLVTMPIDRYSICFLKTTHRNGPLLIECDLVKSKKLVEIVLSELRITENYAFSISFKRNLPIGKGLSSSTADLLSLLRAFQKTFGFKINAPTISYIFTKIEPHDGLMYGTSVLYNHRKGVLLNDFTYTPKFKIIGVDFGGKIDTIAYNNGLNFPDKILSKYDSLYKECIEAYHIKNDMLIASCATKSLKLNLELKNDSLRESAIEKYKKFEALGVINTHSGTCIGFIYPIQYNRKKLDYLAKKVKNAYNLPVFITNSIG